MEKLRSSDKSDKSMDLLKSVKSEDLSKDLHRKSEDFTSNCEGFHDELMNRIEIKV